MTERRRTDNELRGPQASVTRRYRFAAAHRLHSGRLTDEQNRKLFGKCENPNGHGHNYILFVTVTGAIDGESGRVTDVGALDGVVKETVVARFDHRDLNHDPAFAGRTTTGENLVRLIWELLAGRIPEGRLEKIGLIETRDNFFEYAEPMVEQNGPSAKLGAGKELHAAARAS